MCPRLSHKAGGKQVEKGLAKHVAQNACSGSQSLCLLGRVPALPGPEDHAEDCSETLTLLTPYRLQNRYPCWLTPSKPPKGESEFPLPGVFIRLTTQLPAPPAVPGWESAA